MSSYSREEQNNNRLEQLYGKISALRGVTNDIHAHASDHSFIDQASDSMSSMYTSIKGTASRLSRSMVAGHPVYKMVGLALLAFFLIYTLWGYL